MNWVGIAIFALTYVLISARRIGRLQLERPAAAAFGATACVVLGVVSPGAALASIDGDTLLLLLGVMGMGASLHLDGFFDMVEARLLPLARTPQRLLGATVWGAGGLSALLTNDAVCLLAAPLVARVAQRAGLRPTPFLLALATGANTGSVATLVGNPQNMLCGQLGDLDYLTYLATVGPVAIAGLAINHGVLGLAYRAALRPRTPGSQAEGDLRGTDVLESRHAVSLGAILLTTVLYATGAPLAWTALGGLALLLLVRGHHPRRVLRHVDWSLLVFFGGLFVVVEGLRQSGATALLLDHANFDALAAAPGGGLALSGLFLVGSNLVSNVPIILVVQQPLAALPDPTRAWTLLAMASTFAGNLTLLGSAANVIVAERTRGAGSFGFREHLAVGAPIAILTTVVGSAWIMR